MLQRAIWAAKRESNEHIKRLIKVWTTEILTLYFWQQDCYNGKILEQLLWLLCRDKDRVMKIHFFSCIHVLEIKDQDGISNSPAAQYYWAKPWMNLDSSLTLKKAGVPWHHFCKVPWLKVTQERQGLFSSQVQVTIRHWRSQRKDSGIGSHHIYLQGQRGVNVPMIPALLTTHLTL